jgi:hypothetical protein
MFDRCISRHRKSSHVSATAQHYTHSPVTELSRPCVIPGLRYFLREVGCNRESLHTRYEALMRKQRLSASVIFRPVILRKIRAMGISMLGR